MSEVVVVASTAPWHLYTQPFGGENPLVRICSRRKKAALRRRKRVKMDPADDWRRTTPRRERKKEKKSVKIKEVR